MLVAEVLLLDFTQRESSRLWIRGGLQAESKNEQVNPTLELDQSLAKANAALVASRRF